MAQKSQGRWSQDVTEHSDALDIEEGIFAKDDPSENVGLVRKSQETAMGMTAFP